MFLVRTATFPISIGVVTSPTVKVKFGVVEASEVRIALPTGFRHTNNAAAQRG